MLSSCKEQKRVDEESLDTLKTEESQNLTVVMSENGRRSYRFSTPLLEGYTLGRDPYREFRKGVRIITYRDDSLVTVNATLDANYAIYYEKRKLWEAKGNVRVVKFDGTKLYTQQLFWDSTTKRIYSNVDTKVVTASDTHYCEGFDSDEELIELKFRRWKGKMAFEEDAMKSKDSTSVDNKGADKGTDKATKGADKGATKGVETGVEGAKTVSESGDSTPRRSGAVGTANNARRPVARPAAQGKVSTAEEGQSVPEGESLDEQSRWKRAK